MVRVGGLDPSGSERRISGLAVLDLNNKMFIYVGKLYKDSEIIRTILAYKPQVLAIDSPLGFATGFREVDLLMKKMGYPVLPPGWRSMRMLIERSLRLKNIIEKYNIYVIETHPRSALKSSGCSSIEELLEREKITLNMNIWSLSKDELDAVIAAIVAKHYVEGDAFRVEARDGIIYLLPRICG
jgi:predicted nuclease with RNAse H fold